MTSPGGSGASGATGSFGSSGFFEEILGATPYGGVDEVVPDSSQDYGSFTAYANTTKEDYAQQLTDPLTGTGTPLGVLTPLQQIFETVLTDVLTWLSGLVDLPGMIEALDEFLQWLYGLLDRTGFLNVLSEIGELFTTIYEVVDNTVLAAFADFLGWVFTTLGNVFETVLPPVLQLLSNLFGQLDESFGPFLDFVGEVLTVFFTVFGDVVETVLTPALNFLAWLINEFEGVIENVLYPLLQFLKWAWEQFGEAVDSILEPAVEFLKDLFADGFTIDTFFYKFTEGLSGILPDNPQEVIDRLTELALQIPIIGGLVSKITGRTPADGVSLDLSTIDVWARDIERKVQETLDKFEQLGEKIAGQIPISQINLFDVNLLAQGGFLTSSTVEPGGGWVWDSSTNATNTGGSAKVVATGSEQRLYGTQSVKVTPTSSSTSGDRLTLTALVKTSGFTSGTIRLALIPWVGTSRYVSGGSQVTQIVATRSSGASNFTALNGSQWTVPSTVTSVQVALIVNCNAGAEVWFDDVRLTKSGLLVQGLVGQLTAGLAGVIDGLFGNSLGTTILGTAGAAANDLFNPASALELKRKEAEETLASTNTNLFGDPDGGTVVVKEALPLDDIGAEINPKAGSGALLKRTSTSAISATGGRNRFGANFFDALDSSPDITAVKNGSNQYTGEFQVEYAGWYMAELSFKLGTGGTAGFNASPLLYKTQTVSGVTGLHPFKMGGDAIQTATRTNRYAQSSFIVYLTAGQSVAAGYDVDATTATPQFLASTDGVETYFSLSLLNKSYA